MAANWFPVGKGGENGWRLDIVSLLAVIGESSMESHSQTLTSSWTCILPRIIPAPQALLKATRPSRLRMSTILLLYTLMEQNLTCGSYSTAERSRRWCTQRHVRFNSQLFSEYNTSNRRPCSLHVQSLQNYTPRP